MKVREPGSEKGKWEHSKGKLGWAPVLPKGLGASSWGLMMEIRL